VDQGHGLVTDVGRARCIPQVDLLVEQLAQHQSLGQGGSQQQAGIGDGVGIVEADGELVRAVG
jgi:hypothetical protein